MAQDPTLGDDEPAKAAHEVLRSLASGTETSIAFGDVLATAGSRVHGLALLLFALPETLPLPLPSLSGVLGLPLLLISAHLAVFGEGRSLPARLDGTRIPRSVFVVIAHTVGPILEWLERMSAPRWAWLVRDERATGLVCFYLSVILFLPIPLVNAAPAICLATIALGMIQRDGLMMAIGLGGTVLLTAVLTLIGVWAWTFA